MQNCVLDWGGEPFFAHQHWRIVLSLLLENPPPMLGAILGWVPLTQCFQTRRQLWAKVPCRKPRWFPVKQNELSMNFLALVTFSKGFIWPWLPSASSPVVSSTVGEASLGFSHGPFAAMMSMDNFLAPPSSGKELDNLRDWSKSQPQNHDVLC